jgi:uncharacterized phage protein gp47/JayE
MSVSISGGANREETEQFRARVLADIRKPPQGGADRDYIKWAKETLNVSVGNVWPIRKWMGAGTVGVFFTLNDGSTPSSEEVLLVKKHIETEAPITADVYVIAPIEAKVDIQISGLFPDNQTVRNAIATELAHLFIRSAEVEKGSGNAKIYLSHIREAISIAAGESDHVLNSPAADVVFTKGQLPRLGDITWM